MQTYTKETLPVVLRELREAAGLSVTDLAETSGVAHRTIYNVENGEPVRFTTLQALAAALGVRLHSSTVYSIHKN